MPDFTYLSDPEIATINFKGGVGKTTVTWCLADTLATYSNAKVLMFDPDAQMSLTQAVGLNEDNGTLYPAFGKWYEKSVESRRTIFDAIDQYTKPASHFDFPIAYDFIYQISNGLHFVPSVEDLYWLELGILVNVGMARASLEERYQSTAWTLATCSIRNVNDGAVQVTPESR